MDTAAKLRHLLTHWIEHNDAHAQTYREWAERAEQEGHAEAAAGIREAIRSVEAANASLRRAEGSLEG